MKKRTALLLEVLIAMTLLAFCAVMLVRQPVLLHRAEVAQLERLEADRIAALTYVEIKEIFLRQGISWGQIPPLKGKSRVFELPAEKFQVPSLFSREANRSYTIETLKEKQAGERVYRLISLHIEIGSGKKKRRFSYQMNVMKGISGSEGLSNNVEMKHEDV